MSGLRVDVLESSNGSKLPIIITGPSEKYLLSRVFMIAFVASSLDAVEALSVQSVSGLGGGAGGVGKIRALVCLNGRWDSVARA